MMNECFLPTSADRQYVPSFKRLQDQLKFVRVVVHGHWLIKTDVLLSGTDEMKRREVELDPQVNPEEIMSREVELGCESWTSFASGCSSTAVQRTL